MVSKISAMLIGNCGTLGDRGAASRTRGDGPQSIAPGAIAHAPGVSFRKVRRRGRLGVVWLSFVLLPRVALMAAFA
jgi:hypothetical protein